VGTTIPEVGVTQSYDTSGRLSEDARDAMLRGAFLNAPIPHAFLTADGELLEVNDAFLRFVGRTRDKVVGRRLGDLLTEGHAALTSSSSEGLRAGRFEVGIRGLAGTTVPAVLDLFPTSTEATPRFALSMHDPADVRDVGQRLAAQQAFFRGLNRRSWDVAIVADAEGTIVYASPSAQDLFGYDPQSVIARPAFDFVFEEDLRKAAAALEAALAGPGIVRETLRVMDAEGRVRWAEASISNVLDDPDIGGLVINIRDVTREMEAHLALRESEARHRAIAETAQEGIVALAPDGTTIFANQKLAEMVGHSLEVIYQNGLWPVLSGEVSAHLQQRLASRRVVGPERYELPFVHRDGNQRILSISASPLPLEDGEVGSLAMITDVTAERTAVRELRRQALHDPLTGLPNRTLFSDRLAVAAARQERAEGGSLAVLFLDLDDFKQVNDRHGHAAGDELLRVVADRFGAVLRQSDTLARLGGDEFAVICEETGAEEAQLVGRRLVGALEEPVEVGGQRHHVSVSVGIAVAPPADPQELLAKADAAMYAAKARDKAEKARDDHDPAHQHGRVVVHDRTLAAASRRQSELSAEIGDALEEGRLFVEYQPVVDLRTGRMVGIDSMVRWQHPTRGRLRAFDVVTAARSAGREADLERFITETAGREVARLVESGAVTRDCYLGVHAYSAHPVLLEGDELVDELRALRWLPDRLVVRFGEAALAEDTERVIDRAQHIAALGARIALGDAGAGSGSLLAFHRMPIHLVKVDRSIVVGLKAHPHSAGVTRSVAALGASVDALTVAEGVETAEQARMLLELGCDLGQGSFWSGPVPAAELADLSTALPERWATSGTAAR
jgi:diguanylate cyclase (GGDEF)-like protein/PAS domain S-box-containing protein